MNKNIVRDYIEDEKQLDFPNLIKKLIKNDKKCISFRHDGLWIDLGTSQEYLSLIDDLEKIKVSYPQIPIVTN